LPEQESLFAPKATFFEKSKAHPRRFQNSPYGLRQLKSSARSLFQGKRALPFCFAKIFSQKT